MSKPNKINSINNILTNQNYSWKRNFVYTGNTISNEQNPAIISSIRRRVLIDQYNNSNNTSSSTSNSTSTSTKDDDTNKSETSKTSSTQIVPYYSVVVNNDIIHKFHIFRENIIDLCVHPTDDSKSVFYFNGLHDFTKLTYGLTKARYRITNIYDGYPIGILCDDPDVIEIDDGIEADKIIVNGFKPVTLYKNYLYFKILKEFNYISLVTYYPLNGHNIFKYMDSYTNNLIDSSVIHTEYNNGILTDDFKLPSQGYTIECLYDDSNSNVVSFNNNYSIENIDQIKSNLVEIIDELSLTYDFTQDVNSDNIDQYIDKIDVNNIYFYTFNSTTKYEKLKKYGLVNYNNEPTVYSLSISKDYPITLLNNGKEDLIQIDIDIDDDDTAEQSTVNSGSIQQSVNGTLYNFYYGDILITVSGNFSQDAPLSGCGYNSATNTVSYMGLKDKFIYTDKCDFTWFSDFDNPGINDGNDTSDDEEQSDQVFEFLNNKCKLHFNDDKSENDDDETIPDPNLDELNNDAIQDNTLTQRKIIKLENISFKYNKQYSKTIYNNIFHENENTIFENINLDFNYRDKIIVYGSKSSGKSTFIKLLSKLLKPTNGNIYILNKNISELSIDNYIKYIDNTCISNYFKNKNKFDLNIDNHKTTLQKYNLMKYLDSLYLNDDVKIPYNIKKIFFLIDHINSKQPILVFHHIINENAIDQDYNENIVNLLLNEYNKTIFLTTTIENKNIINKFNKQLNIDEINTLHNEPVTLIKECKYHSNLQTTNEINIERITDDLKNNIWSLK